MDFLHNLFQQSPEIAFFLSLAFGFWFGNINFYKFKFGGVAGSLIFAVLFSLAGVHIDNGVKSLLFALFIFAVGYESGPSFFSSLGRKTLREITLAVFMAASALATVVILAKLFHLDKGLAAGLAAGGLTQSAIIGTAGDALSKLGYAPDVLKQMQANVATGYAVSYVTGSIGAIIVCVAILPMLMGRGIREDALVAEAEMNAADGAGKTLKFSDDQRPVLPQIVGRIFEVGSQAGKSVEELESSITGLGKLTIELVRHKGEVFTPESNYQLHADDQILLVGRRELLIGIASSLGKELPTKADMQMAMITQDVLITSPEINGNMNELVQKLDEQIHHGAYITRLVHDGKTILLNAASEVHKGDVVRLYGLERDVKRLAQLIGTPLAPSTKIDYVFMSVGLIVGLLIGLLVWKVNGSISLTLGSGGGCLLSGLIFGWVRSRRPIFGELPKAATQLMKDLGLAGFVVVIGLTSGKEAIQTIQEQGVTLFLLGVAICVIPLLLTMLFGRFVLGYRNAALFAGALSGSRSANPAFGEILNIAGNSIPTIPFAVTYALANVLLTLVGPLIVALV